MSEWGRASGSPVSSEWKARDMEEHRRDIAEEVARDRRAHSARRRVRRRWWLFRRRST